MAKKLSDDELKALLDAEIRQAIDAAGGKLSEQRRRAQYYYHGLAKGDLAPPEVDGRSTFVDTTIRNQIEWMIPSLMKTFCSGESVVEFSATKEGDEEKAKQATDYVNYVFYKKNDGYNVLQTAIRDALLLKAGIIKVWWDDREEETKEEYKALTDIDLAQLMQDDEIEPVEQKSYPDEDDAEQRQQAIAQLTPQLEQAMQAVQQGDQQAIQAAQQLQAQIEQINAQPPKMLYDVTFKRTKEGGKLCIEAVPPEEFLINRDAKSIKEASFVGHRVQRTLSDLKAFGYKNVDDITSDEVDSYNGERVERVGWDSDTQGDADSQDPSMRVIWMTECYVKVDMNGTGIAEWRKVVKAGNQLLENEECDGPPFCALIPIILPHRFFGLSIADLGFEPQRLQTQLVRAMTDNLFLQINKRHWLVEGQVNLDDFLTSRPGGGVRVKAPGMIGELGGASSDAGGMQMLEWMQDFSENSTGWTRRSQGVGASGMQQQTATGMNIITNRDDMRLDLIARNFAEGGITELFRLMLKLIGKYQTKEDIIAVSGKWVQISPREWKNQFSLNINVGLGTNNKEQQAQHLMGLMQIQREALQIGVATPENVYNAAKLYAEALGQKSGDKFFTDPKNVPPRDPAPDPEMIKIQGMMQLKDKELQADVQKYQAEQVLKQKEIELNAQKDNLEADRRLQIDSQKAELDMRERQHEAELKQSLHAQQLQFDQWKAQLDADTKILVAEMQSKTSITQSRMSANSGKVSETLTDIDDAGNEAPTSALTGLIESMNNNMATLVSTLTKPKQIIRDENGKAQGIA